MDHGIHVFSFFENLDDNKAKYLDLHKGSEMADGGSLEKLILDHSSADDSMEEDALETKQTDSNHNSSEVGNKIEMTEVTGSKVGGKVDDVGTDLSSDRTVPPSEKKDNVATLEKRKFQGTFLLNIFSLLLPIKNIFFLLPFDYIAFF